MRSKHYLCLISLSGNKCAKAIIGKYKCSILFLTTILSLFAAGSNAQNITIGNNQDVTVSKTDYDDCGSIFELSLSISNDYYFAFQLMEDGKMISSSNLTFTGDAAGFTSSNDKNVIHPSNQYVGSTTLYLNTRNGYPYVLSSEAPSLTDYFVKTTGKTTIEEGDAINFTTVVCPTAENYTYQWYENGTAITSQTNADLSNYTPTVANAEYKLEISENDAVVASKTIKINTLGKETRFTVDNWWGVSPATSSCKELAGYCNSVYLITLNYTDNNPKFAIKENGIEIGSDKVSIDASITTINAIKGDDGLTPGWSATGQLNGETEVYYLDARATPYKITKTLSNTDFLVTQITKTKGDVTIQRGEKVSFSSDICGSVATEGVTYQWYESINGGLDWTAIEGATGETLSDVEPTTDGTSYKVIATSGALTSNSNEITINFLPSSVLVTVTGANKINSVEYEAPNNQEVTITAKAVEMTDVTYKLLYKTFEEEEWKEATFSGGENFWTFTPTENLEYQITATGVSTSTQKVETYKTNILIRIVYQCDANSTTDTLWFDDFGRFLDRTTYIAKDANGAEQTYSGSITDSQGQVYSIVNFFSADPNFFVQKHEFADQDPLFGPYDSELCEADAYKHYACWEGCDGYRVEDGYYAILSNPDLSNCGKAEKDYWNGSDHTGNINGGMLFVNCSEDSKDMVIYEREITINSDCDNVQLLFSAFISNAAIPTSSKPVNVRLDIYNEDGNLIHSVSSGDVMPRNTGEKWSNMTFKFKASGQKYKIKLTNNNEGGAENFGNDILFDDISITICYPNINLLSDLNDKTKKKIETCQLDTIINLYAFNENDIKSYIDNPKYIFQYKKENGNWQNLTEITDVDHTSISLNRTDTRFHGISTFRTIVASSEEVINKICDGEELEVNCEQVYAIDSTFIVNFLYSGPMGADIDTSGCIGEVMNLVGDPSSKPRYEWVDATTGTVLGKEKTYTFTIDGTEEKHDFFFIGYEELGCPDTQRVTVHKKEFVAFDAPETFIVCEYDSLIKLSNIVPTDAKFTWSLNGEVDNTQTGSTFKIADGSPLKGSISVTGSADGYCDSTRTIAYEIYKKFDLELALSGDVTEGKLCFAEEGDVKATATHTPESAKPSKYYWYRDNILIGETTENVTNNIISENGKYEYKVIATDGICYTSTDNAPWDIDSVSASKTVGLTLDPKDTIVCQGQPITFNVNVSNALEEVDITWSGDDVNGGNEVHKTKNFKDEITIMPSKTTAFTDKNTITISVPDDICPGGFVKREMDYYIHNNIDLSIEAKDTYCLKDGDNLNLTAKVDSGVPTKYVWYKNGEEVTTTTTNSTSIPVTDGKNEYKVIASDDICSSKTSDIKAIEARNPITLAIEPLDSVFCEGTTITFRAKVTNALDSEAVALTWTGDDIEGDITTKGHIASLDRTPLKKDTKTETRNIQISTPDEVCNAGVSVTANTSYKIHNKMDVKIDEKDIYCLSNGSDIQLTATVNTGEPTSYTWYKGGEVISTTTTNVANIAISDGKNNYTVVASDGICNNATSIEKSIEARKPIEIAISPKDTVFCEGTSINFKSVVKNALDAANVIVTWSGDDFTPSSTTTGSEESVTITPTKKNSVTETRTVTISTKDSVCASNKDVTASTTYSIHNKIELSIDAERSDDLFCLTKEDGDSIRLTANVTKGEPTKYEWFRNGDLLSTTAKKDSSFAIASGANSYTVKASDGICEATTSSAREIQARNKMSLTLTPDLEKICEGESITFKAKVTNALNDNTIVSWKGDDIAAGTTTNGTETTYKMTTTKSGNKVEAGHTVITATDEVCKDNHPKDSVNYNVYMKIGIELLSNTENGSRCMTKDASTQKVTLTIHVKKGNPTKYVWFDKETTTWPDTFRVIALKEGTNNFYVLATDGVCNKEGSEAKATNDIEVREPISVDLSLDKYTVCVNTEVKASVIINNTHEGSTTNIEWTPEGNPQPGADCGGGVQPCNEDKGRPSWGKGTKTDPYRIGTAEELKWFADLVNGDLICNEKDSTACALLTNDIDLSNIGNWPLIGKSDIGIVFSGMIDGGNHTIKGLTYNDAIYQYAGFVGIARDAEIKNIKLTDSKLAGDGSIGGICGGAFGKTKITNCSNDATVISKHQFAGGICGFFTNNSEISNCYNTGSISSNSRSGGICGGIANSATITDSYNTGTIVTASQGRSGGIVGSVDYGGDIKNCHSVGIVKCTSEQILGSIIGFTQGSNYSVDNCFYVDQTDTHSGTTKMTESQFGDGTVLAALNTNNVWKQAIGEDKYPTLIQGAVGTYDEPSPNNNGNGGSSSNNGLDNLCNGTYTNKFDLTSGTHQICVKAYASDSKICPANESCVSLSIQDSLRLFMRQDTAELCQRSDSAQYVRLYTGIHSGVPSSIIWSTGDTTDVKTDTIRLGETLMSYVSKIMVAPNRDSIYWAYGTDDVCKNSNKVYSDTVRVSNLLQVTMTADPTNVQMGEEVTLTATTTNDEHGDFSWYDAESGELLGTTEENEFKYRIEDNGIYKFYVSVDNNYCGDIASTKKRISVADFTVVPNIITPYNSNQKNNVFMGPKDDKPGYRVEIYNRYQQMVFEGDNGWDGTYRGQLAEPGTYFYRVFMKDGRVFKGTVEVAKF